MHDIPKTKIASGIAIVGGVLLLLGPLLFGLYGFVGTAGYLLALVAMAVGIKTLVRPGEFDNWILVGVGARAILAAFIGGGVALAVNILGGGAVLGAGLWRRMINEPEGGPHVSAP